MGWGLGFVTPLGTGLSFISRLAVGCFLLLASVSLATWGLLTFKRRGTTHEPNGVASALLVTGPFRWSRNPLYVALSALLAGFGFLLDSGWILGLVPALVLLLDRLVIVREELRLRAQFGDDYQAYTRHVRRWL